MQLLAVTSALLLFFLLLFFSGILSVFVSNFSQNRKVSHVGVKYSTAAWEASRHRCRFNFRETKFKFHPNRSLFRYVAGFSETHSRPEWTKANAVSWWCTPNRFSPRVNTSSRATAWTWKCGCIDDEPGLIRVRCRQVSALNQSQHSQHLWNTDAWRTQPRTAPPRDPGRKDNKNSGSAESWSLLHNTCLIFTH